MTGKRQYWVVSPNVTSDEKTAEEMRRGRAFMGWEPDNYGHGQIGPKFAGKTARSIQRGDIILIARRSKGAPDVVGFGVVEGRCKPQRLRPSGTVVYVRELRPFKRWDEVSKGIDLHDVLKQTRALVQLHPEASEAHKKVCEWVEEQLRPKVVNITKIDLSKSTFGYEIKKKGKVTTAREIEAELLWDYKCWLDKRGRKLTALKYGKLQCDGWEEMGRNLIEAKGSINREDIRMAVGQLLGYAFQGKGMFKKPHMAVLLPEKPDPDSVKWLVPHGINIIWRRGRSFLDNAHGRFVRKIAP